MITDDAVRRAVALVESVTREFFEQIEDRVRFLLRNLVRACTTFDEVVALFRHGFFVLLAHRAAKQIGLRERVAPEFARRRHHLFLVNHHAVGVGADFLEQRMQILNRRDSLFRFHVLGNQFHRSRPIERDQRDDVIELLDLELLREVGHPTGLHLEKTDRLAAVVETKRLGIIERDVF